MFHGKIALRKILEFQGETSNLSEKFQGEIQIFPGENMELYRQIVKFQGEILVFPGEKEGFPKDFLHYFS